MYWYYKWPLTIILLLLGVGICSFIWRSCVAPAFFEQSPASGAQSELTAAAGSPTTGLPAPGSQLPEDSQGLPPSPGGLGATPGVSSAAVNVGIAQLLNAAEGQMLADKPLAARELARRALSSPGVVEFDQTWWRAATLINQANGIFMNSAAPCPEKQSYVIRRGDSLSRIGTLYHSSVGALQRLNELSRTNPIIHPGNSLQLLSGDWSIRVSKSQFALLVLLNNELFRVYRVGIGRQDRTPTGSFVISSKIIHPAWTPPGKHILYGDPENILGTHWMGLSPTGNTDPALSGYGIHGTWEPESIGTAASAGCIRMRNEEVEELYDFIPMPGDKAPIVPVSISE
jgi:hypothetical protein